MNGSQFNVFLCHNSEDKPQVRMIAECLRKQGINPWLDEWELRPGIRWQRVLEEQISQIEAAAVFVGSNGFGPWQQQELEAFLLVFAKNDKPLIPVLLPDAPQKPELPLFLLGRPWVDFRQNHPEPMGQLIWGVTGKRPSYEESLSLEVASGLTLPKQSDPEGNSDLEKLEIFLSAQKWQEADEQTKRIILKGNQSNLLMAPQIRQLPLELLDGIDQLWTGYSNRKFGLRIQQQIWQKILNPEKPRFGLFAKKVEPLTDSKAWNRFGCVVGWRSDDEKFLTDAKLNFSIKAPSGCFPRTRLWLDGGMASVKQFVVLMERVGRLE
jgi:hypothetical protein